MQTITIRTIKTTASTPTKTLFWFLFAGTRGSKTRIKIISLLRKIPSNLHQLSLDLDFDYKSIQHHIRVLSENDLVTKIGGKYGATYFVSEKFQNGEPVFNEIVAKLQKFGKLK